MAMHNPQASFEDSIYGPNGTHPAPKTLPYPTCPIKTLYGDTVEYIIPDGQKEKVLKKLFPFGDPPPMSATWMDIHEKREFVIKDFKVVQQGDYVLLVSPYFAKSGGSVVDWQPIGSQDDGVHVSPMSDELADSAYSAGYADGFTGMPKGTAEPRRDDGMSQKRHDMLKEIYAAGFDDGTAEREGGRDIFRSVYTNSTRRHVARHHR